MADSDVIKEFLVALGFKVDDAGLKKFEKAVNRPTDSVLKLGAAVTGVAAAVQGFVVLVGNELEKLYFASQRVKASVENIQDFELSLQKLGVAGQDARSVLENLAAFIRTNPAAEGFIGILGVNTRHTNGQLRDTVDIVTDLTERFRGMPHWLAAKFAQRLGIDEQTLFQMLQGTGKLEDRYRRLYRAFGMNADSAAKQAHEFMNQLRDLGATVTVTSQAIAVYLLPYAQRLNDWLQELIRTAMSADWSQWSSRFRDTGKAIDEVITKVIELASTIGSHLGGEKTGLGLLDAINNDLNRLAKALKVVIDLLNGEWGKAWESAKEVATDWWDKSPMKGWWEWLMDNRVEAPPYQPRNYNEPFPDNWWKQGSLPLGVRNNNPGNLRSWGDAPIKDGFARFKTVQEGISAMAGNLLAYSRRGWTSVSQIISKWAPPEDNNDTGSYIQTVAKKLGVSPHEKLDLHNPEVLRKLMSAMIVHEQGYQPYSDAIISAGINSRLASTAPALTQSGAGQGSVSINQTTEINVNGGETPKETASSIASEQSRVNADLIRNTKGAIR